MSAPPRSWLFVPADSERKITKALESDADAVIFDLEDSVTAERKDAARAKNIVVGFAGLLFKFLTSETGQHIVKTVFDHVLQLLPF